MVRKRGVGITYSNMFQADRQANPTRLGTGCTDTADPGGMSTDIDVFLFIVFLFIVFQFAQLLKPSM